VAAKDVRAVLKILRPIVASVQFVTLQSPRAMSAVELLEIWHQLASEVPGCMAASLTEALEHAPAPTLVAGSLYLCGETLALLQAGRAFEVSAQ
jgi:folylpolyglutamate synthase/dihydropteroate synthase